MRRDRSLVGLILLALALPGSARAQDLLQGAALLGGDEKERHLLVELRDDAAFQPAPPQEDSEAFQRFRAWARGFAALDQGSLLRGQLEAARGNANAVARHELLLRGEVGRITSATRLERRLFEVGLEASPPWRFPGEVMAWVLRSSAEPGRWRVYASFGDGRATDGSPPVSQAVLERVAADLSRGWALQAHLHSHPFMVAYPPAPHVGGTVYPSDEDLQGLAPLLESWGLREVWITNGLDTLRLDPAGVRRLLETVPSHEPYRGPEAR